MMKELEREVEEVRRKIDLSRALEAEDTNKDGVVTREEMVQALAKYVPRQEAEAAADALIRYLDQDNDGAVATDKLQRFLARYGAKVAQAEVKRKAEVTAGEQGSTSSSGGGGRVLAKDTTGSGSDSDSEGSGTSTSRPSSAPIVHGGDGPAALPTGAKAAGGAGDKRLV